MMTSTSYRKLRISSAPDLGMSEASHVFGASTKFSRTVYHVSSLSDLFSLLRSFLFFLFSPQSLGVSTMLNHHQLFCVLGLI